MLLKKKQKMSLQNVKTKEKIVDKNILHLLDKIFEK